MLYSTPSVRAFNQSIPRNKLAPQLDLSNSGSTIASIAFNNRNSYDKYLPESTFEMSITDQQDLNSQANYESYLKHTGNFEDTMEYEDDFELSYTDNRIIKAAGHYDLSIIDEEPSSAAYSDQQELTQVVDLYKDQIEKTIKNEDDFVNSPSIPTERIISTDKSSAIRKKCIDLMGKACFDEVYCFLKSARINDVPDNIIVEQAVRRWGKAANGFCLLVDQLLFIER